MNKCVYTMVVFLWVRLHRSIGDFEECGRACEKRFVDGEQRGILNSLKVFARVSRILLLYQVSQLIIAQKLLFC